MSDNKLRPQSLRVIALMFIATIVLTGCSGIVSAESLSGEAAEIAAAPALGPTVTGNGYSFATPVGWSGSDVPPPGVDVISGSLTDTDSFVDNVCVMLAAGEFTPQQVEWRAPNELKDAGASDVTRRGRVMVAGSESAHLSAIISGRGVESRMEKFYVTTEGQTYIVTFSFSLAVPKSERDAVSQSVLASWVWV